MSKWPIDQVHQDLMKYLKLDFDAFYTSIRLYLKENNMHPELDSNQRLAEERFS